MICLSPLINKDLQLNPIFQLNVSFMMDNMKIIPDRSNLTIVDDPVYYSFENSIQKMNSNYIIQIEVKFTFFDKQNSFIINFHFRVRISIQHIQSIKSIFELII